jgi:glycosyltransferase involved in cell wall biosynthesis
VIHLRVAVVIPCFRVRARILDVLERIGPEVDQIYCVDDACPEHSGAHIEASSADPRVTVLHHADNLGVGGAVITGYRRALADGADIVIKMDGDGQMDPGLIAPFVRPIATGQADYTKGNRFHDRDTRRAMPPMRLFGNAVLSFLTKMSTGYWRVLDPTNGYTAIHGKVLRALPMDQLSQDYFFETDMLFRLGAAGAVVVQVPMRAIYRDEVSNLRIRRIVVPFLLRHMANTARRIFSRSASGAGPLHRRL